ncbi:MAG: LysR family transcriptional regulator [Sneathiella sp.]|nr:LysR family transcriptional regulator [Sneathiella sp.]
MSNFASGLNFRQLEIFSAVVEAGSTTKSALRLGLSQPAVSRNVSQLEQDLGFTLFDRVGGRLIPTEAALRLHAEAKKAFKGIEEVVSSARNKDAVKKGSIRIAAVPSLSLSFLPKAMKKFILNYPDVTMSFETRTSQMSMEMVADRRMDLALISMPLAHPGLKLEILTRPKGVCVMPKGHPLAKKDVIDVQDLHGENFIPMSRSHNSRHVLEELFANAGVFPNIKLETSTIEMACVLVQEGLGITVVNEMTAAHHKPLGVELRPFKHPMNYSYAFVFPINKPPSEITRIFVTHIKEYLAETLGY